MRLIGLFAGCFFLIASDAYAYVDPNTGGYVFQILFPIVSAITAGYIFFKTQIKRAIGRMVEMFRKNSDK